ncbi:sigma-54-dependent Fis family transcriptional regulator [Fictibacillus phosphorivorans]|uniref:sigma-54-dependent Fis family transcriptional regulator n=1 Tax=Fictibacillus phosphorivorans TaxID=1221500 RepID=UPI0020416888|nr:sigma 54-interacting transcriptional regulator [Fictibacillus phosphorivorans]MCM3718559.1 sigma 54-interacting transcriptional regulator [Fictibacillus phosphorivorans]MCM3776085.1 sigma 54-interacting transcriptional regulator [Fictibacillus phosphorivorans]
MNLIYIQPAVQQIADAIAAVLKIEVEIADQQLIRVAGTGKTKSGVLNKMEGDLVYKSAIRTGRTIVIENPGFHEVCTHCHYYQNCSETGEICAPIRMGEKVIGVIGLLAFNEKQKKRLFSNIEDNKQFLYKMADLIASKLKEHEMLMELTDQSEKLYQMMNMVDQGILLIDKNGNIKQLNAKAKKLLHVKDEHELNVSAKEKLLSVIHSNEKQRITLNIQNIHRDFLIYGQDFINCAKNPDKMVILLDIEDIQKTAELTNVESRRAFDSIIGVSTQMRELKDYAFKVSRSNSTVFLQGESGTGKEIFANAIHLASGRKKKPFITVNCGAIPENLLESELFGYEAGAFTGALKGGKKGKFELADKGTLFLDEIGEMPPMLQVKLLRVLQQGEVERIGGNKPISVNVRIIAATNRNIHEMVRTGEFREDLFYRLNVIPIILPPLRNRKEDILALADHFIMQFNEQFQSNVIGMGEKVKNILLHYHWPGNARELKNFIEYIFNFISNGYITLENAGALIEKRIKVNHTVAVSKKSISSFSLAEIEKEHIRSVLEHVKNNGKNTEYASKLLGIGRATLFRKIKQYQL